MLHRPERGGGAGRDADLGVDVLDVVIGGLRRDVEPIGDLPRREPLRREPQHIDFAAGQPARMSAAVCRRRRAARRGPRPRVPLGSREARARPATRAGAARRPRPPARTAAGLPARWSAPRRSPSRPARTLRDRRRRLARACGTRAVALLVVRGGDRVQGGQRR